MTYKGAHADHPGYVVWCLRRSSRFLSSEPFQGFVAYRRAKDWEQRSDGSEQQGKGHKSKDAPKKKEKKDAANTRLSSSSAERR